MSRHRILSFPVIILTLLSGLLCSCQKAININLNSASPQTVVQGNISNQPGNYSVVLSQTVNFSDPSIFPPLTGAIITINDNFGNIDTLKDSIPGTYTGHKFIGTPGRPYTLSITASGKNYTSTSIMPQPVNIDSLTAENSPFGRKNKFVNVRFQSPAGITTYYHLVEIVNDTVQTPVFAYSDQYQVGQQINFLLRSPSDSVKLKTGDTVTVLLQSIDENTYNYYSALINAAGTGFNTAPANPPSNVSNGALGYFSAYAVTRKTIVIP